MKHNFHNLQIWTRSMDLANKLYDLTKLFPNSEKYGLSDQIRRSAVSVPSNIAEGCGRNSPAQLSHFVNIVYGSLCELETQVRLSSRQNFLTDEQSNGIISELVEIRKMIYNFSATIKAKN